MPLQNKTKLTIFMTFIYLVTNLRRLPFYLSVHFEVWKQNYYWLKKQIFKEPFCIPFTLSNWEKAYYVWQGVGTRVTVLWFEWQFTFGIFETRTNPEIPYILLFVANRAVDRVSWMIKVSSAPLFNST